jgi:aminoglycoside phosphotransferase (APT) family kinase protein
MLRGMRNAVLIQRAVRAAAQVARDNGLSFAGEPVVLHEGSNLLLHLHPAPVVARVATTTAMVREGDAWLTREVAVAGYVASQGAPTVVPSDELPPGPHHFSGLTMTFWQHVDALPERADPKQAGRALRECHTALAGYPEPAELPAMAVLSEAERIIERFAGDGTLSNLDAGLLREAAADVTARIDALGLPLQVVHGDSHLGNVINTPDGPLWTDWEDTCLAPTPWDLGCLLASGRYFGDDPAPGEAAVKAYGESPDDAFVQARRLQGTVWGFVFARDHPERTDYAERLMAHYR